MEEEGVVQPTVPLGAPPLECCCSPFSLLSALRQPRQWAACTVLRACRTAWRGEMAADAGSDGNGRNGHFLPQDATTAHLATCSCWAYEMWRIDHRVLNIKTHEMKVECDGSQRLVLYSDMTYICLQKKNGAKRLPTLKQTPSKQTF